LRNTSLRNSLLCLYVVSTASSFSNRSLLAISSFQQLHNFNSKGSGSSDSSMSTSLSSDNVGLGDIGKADSQNKETESSGKMSSNDKMTSWREKIEVSAARSRKVRGGNYVQLATVDPETLEPRCRTVVFRGFCPFVKDNVDGSPCVMKMITDSRSKKVGETTSIHPKNTDDESRTAEMVWWFTKSSEQYRIRGKLAFIGGGQFPNDTDFILASARKQQWGSLSDMAREQFYWRDPETSFETQAQVPYGGRDDEGKMLPPPDNFLLMLLYPKRVDYLRLTDNFRQIDTLSNGTWSADRVNP